MSYTLFDMVAFGSSKTGLTPNYRLYNPDHTAAGSLISSGIVEFGFGYYGAITARPDSFTGAIRWIAGDGSPDVWLPINPRGDSENLDAKISSIIGSAGTGAYAITVTVSDGSNPLQNARVTVREGVNQYTASTNVSGVASFSLDAATYTISISKPGYSFTPTTILVTGAANFNKVMTAIVIPVPGNPTLCNVYGTFIDLEGNPLEGIEIKFTLLLNPVGTNASVLADRTVTATTNASGQLIDGNGNTYISLARNDYITPTGSAYRVDSTAAHLANRITLEAATFNLGSLA